MLHADRLDVQCLVLLGFVAGYLSAVQPDGQNLENHWSATCSTVGKHHSFECQALNIKFAVATRKLSYYGMQSIRRSNRRRFEANRLGRKPPQMAPSGLFYQNCTGPTFPLLHFPHSPVRRYLDRMNRNSFFHQSEQHKSYGLVV